jgi:hypothetical protein
VVSTYLLNKTGYRVSKAKGRDRGEESVAKAGICKLG